MRRVIGKQTEGTAVRVLEAQVGYTVEQQDALKGLLAEKGIRLALHRRSWDARLFPAADRGYFKFKKQIPRILDWIQASYA